MANYDCKYFYIFLILFIYIKFHPVMAHTCELGNNTENQLTAFCNSRGLTGIPTDLPANIISLNVAHNNIESLDTDVFYKYPDLESLDLNNNKLCSSGNFQNASFKNLPKLKELNIVDNGCDTSKFSSTLFSGLCQLRILKMDWKCFDSYISTDALLQPVINITNITFNMYYMDKRLYFDKYFLNFKHLRRIEIYEPNGVTEKTFENFANSPIVSLSLDCNNHDYVNGFGINAFIHLKYLETLVVVGCIKIELENMTQAIKSSNLSNMHTLVMDGIGRRSKNVGILTADMIDSPSFKNITHLSMKHTHIVAVEIDFFLMIPNIRHLSIGYNDMVIFPMDEHFRNKLAFVLQKLNIEIIDISNFLTNTVGPFESYKHTYIGLDESKYFRITSLKYKIPVYCDNTKENITVPNNVTYDYQLLSYIPKTLTTIYADNFPVSPRVPPVHEITFELNFAYIDASFLKYPSFLQVIFTFLTKLQVLKCSSCYLYDERSFLNFLEGKKFVLKWFILDGSKINVSMLSMFAAFPELIHINMSSCGLVILPQNIFASNRFLQEIDLQNNAIKVLDIQINQLYSLHYINISQNQLEYISDVTTSGFEILNNHSREFKLYVSNNIFHCRCENSKFISWWQTTIVDIVDKGSIYCINYVFHSNNDTLAGIDMWNFNAQCEIVMIISIVFAILFLVSFVIGIFAYRNRVNVCWFMYKVASQLNCQRQNVINKSSCTHCKYRTMILYNIHSIEDCDWVQNTLMPQIGNTGVYDLRDDFQYNETINEHVAEALENCATCLIVLSPDFTEDDNEHVLHFLHTILLILKSPDQLILIESQKLKDENIKLLPFVYRLLYHQKNYLLKWSLFEGNNAKESIFWEIVKDRIAAYYKDVPMNAVEALQWDTEDPGIVLYATEENLEYDNESVSEWNSQNHENDDGLMLRLLENDGRR